MRKNDTFLAKTAVLAACLVAWTWNASAVTPPSRTIRPAPPRPTVSGFAPAASRQAAARPVSPASRPVARPAPAVLPASLTSVDCYLLPARSGSFGGGGVFSSRDRSSAASPRATVHWWANTADVDKSGLVLLFAYTLEYAPSRVRNVVRPLPAAASGRQTADFAVPGDAGRILSWRADLLQRGRPLSSLQSPEWEALP